MQDVKEKNIKKERQCLLDKEMLFFDLRRLINEHNVAKAAVVFDCEVKNISILQYLREMDIVIKECDFTDVSYVKDKVSELLRGDLFDETQLIIAMGDGTLLNCIKYAKRIGKTGDAPVIAIPTYIEAGDEANGQIIFYNGKDIYYESSKAAVPEYVLYDPELVEVGNKRRTNDHFARGLCKALSILWSNDPDSEAAADAAQGLKALLANATKIMRGERSAFADAFEGSRLIGHASELSERNNYERLALWISDAVGITLGHAMMKIAAPISIILEDKLNEAGLEGFKEQEVESFLSKELGSKEKDVYNRMMTACNIVAPGTNHIRSLSFQLRFLERALDLHTGDISEEKCIGLAKSIDRELFKDWPVEITENDIKLFLLHVTHLETMKRAIDRYEMHIARGEGVNRNTLQLAELKEKYKADLSDDRIILEPYFEQQMKRRKMVKGLQKDVLETLLLSKDFLEKNGLRYYLSEGTLLGAVRHKGFIPWDDDVDIMMPREDYNRLVELDREGKIPPELHFDALENNPKHWVLGAKLQLTRESKYSQEKVKNLSEFNGPYIDVFPLDYWNSPYSKKQYRAQRVVKMCRRLLFMKTGYSRKIKWKWHRMLMLLSLPFIPNTFIEKQAIKHMTKFNNGNRKYMVHLCSYYRFYKEVFPTGFYGEPVYMEFEGHMFPVPREYDYMLRTIYGNNYDSLPPARVAGLRNHPFEVAEE